jgi:hypothetical protein
MGARFVRLGAAMTELERLEPGRVRAGNEFLSVEVDLASGAVFPGGPRMPRMPVPDLASSLGAARERLLETDAGPITELDDAGRVHRLEGAVQSGVLAPGAARLVAMIVATPTRRGTRTELALVSLASGAAGRLPAQHASRLAADDDLVVCSVPGGLHVVRAEQDGTFGALTLPLPATARPAQVVIDRGHVVALAGALLVTLDASALVFARGHRVEGLSIEEHTARGRATPEPATVVFVMADKVLADHPTLRRLTLPRTASSPTVQRGERVCIDDVREELPGLFRVHAWRREGDAPANVRGGETLTLAAPTLPDREDDGPIASPARTSAHDTLAALSRTHGFDVPERMLAWLRLVDDDAVVRRWCAKLWLDPIEVRGLVRDWDADPCLVAFAGLGNGDELCLYVHPDAPPGTVVLYCHETNTIEEPPLSFDAWMDGWLARFERGDDASARDLAGRLRARLSLPSLPTATATEPPRWWRAAARVGELADDAACVREAERALAEGRVRDAERWWLAHYLLGHDPSARARLRAIYEQLGWSLPRAMLETRDV